MMRSMYAAIGGLRTHQTMLDVTANDMANVNTVAYKSARTTFRDSLSQLQRGASAPGGGQGGSNPVQVGLGVQLNSIDSQMGSGALQSTGNGLDLAIQGSGWFRVGATTPPAVPTSFQYTRAGNFTLNQAGDLVTQDGLYVMGLVGGPPAAPGMINIPPGSTDLSIGQDGVVRYVDPVGAPQVAGTLTLAKFANEGGLVRASGNRWLSSPNSGAETVGTPGGQFGLTIAGTLEMSNVDLASEFTDMITSQRGFQANSRVISTSDEMLSDLVNLKR